MTPLARDCGFFWVDESLHHTDDGGWPRLDQGPDGPGERLHLTLPGDSTAITPIVDRVLAFVRKSHAAHGKEFEVETALREALANAIRYGSRHDASQTIHCTVICESSGDLVIVVRDPGPGFDFESVMDPLADENKFSHHGRGIYLINQLMDDVRFERGGSEIWMRMRAGKA